MTTPSKTYFRRNVVARLKHLGVAAHAAAVETGHRGAWLSDVLAAKRSPKGVSHDVGDEVAKIVGIPQCRLIEQCDVKAWPPPKWVPPYLERVAAIEAERLAKKEAADAA